jgi:hypothetical protein
MLSLQQGTCYFFLSVQLTVFSITHTHTIKHTRTQTETHTHTKHFNILSNFQPKAISHYICLELFVSHSQSQTLYHILSLTLSLPLSLSLSLSHPLPLSQPLPTLVISQSFSYVLSFTLFFSHSLHPINFSIFCHLAFPLYKLTIFWITPALIPQVLLTKTLGCNGTGHFKDLQWFWSLPLKRHHSLKCQMKSICSKNIWFWIQNKFSNITEKL